MKKCSKCTIEKPLTEFHKRKNRACGYTSQCKSCRKKYTTKRTKNYMRNYDLKKSYGITLDDYNSMLSKQNGCCFICETHVDDINTGRKKNLCVDHCHKTNEVRGLLCDNCNRGIGLLRDSKELLKRAIKYLS